MNGSILIRIIDGDLGYFVTFLCCIGLFSTFVLIGLRVLSRIQHVVFDSRKHFLEAELTSTLSGNIDVVLVHAKWREYI